LPLAWSSSSGKAVRNKTVSKSSGLMLEFYRQETLRILARRKYLSTF
jgi:hypothetical protein